MNPTQLSRELREGEGELLDHRRSIVVLALAAAGSMALIALYQIGILKHIPEPALPGLDADKVDASPEAYAVLQTPDAFLGLGSYVATMGLAAMGGRIARRRTRSSHSPSRPRSLSTPSRPPA